MILPRSFGTLLVLWLLAMSLNGRAEGIRSRLSKTRFDSLRNELRRRRPDTSRVQLLLLLSQDFIYQYDALPAATDLRTGLAYCEQAAALSEQLRYAAGRIGSLYVRGELHHYLGQDTLGPGFIRQGLAESRRRRYPRLEAFGWLYLGECYGTSAAALATKLACFQRGRALFRQLGDKTDEAYLLKCVADVHLQQGLSAQTIRELLEVKDLYRAAGHRRLHYTYDLLHATYRHLGDYKEALRYGLMALASAEATQDTVILGGLYVRLAVAYRELKQYPNALVYYRKALANFQLHRNDVNSVLMAGAIARIMVAQQRPREALAFYTQTVKPYTTGTPRLVERVAEYMVELQVALGHYAAAQRYVAQITTFLASGAADEGQAAAMNLVLGRFYLLTKHYDEARPYLQQALKLNQHRESVLRLADINLLLFKVDSAQGRFPAAITHYQRYKLLTDSVFNETKNKQLASLEIQYDTRKKEQNIALLTRQAQAQQARLRQREFQRNALVVGSLLLASLLLMGYNRYRLKQRATRLLEAQQAEINQQNQALQHLLTEKDWMLKEIHHRVKNNLEVISSLLETQSDYLLDPAALAALREGQNRVHAMALIHQKLYQSDNLAVVDMAAYIREISEHLVESFDCQHTVQMRLAVVPIQLEVTLATPLGLIINEALTNALKYAFPYRQPGTVTVELVETGPQLLRLTIADDGVGFPPQFDVESNSTMGLTIMRGLSGQLDGQLLITQNGGVHVRLDFGSETASAGSFRTGSAATPF